MTAAGLVERLRSSVVRVRDRGAGIVWRPGAVLTNLHVIAGTRRMPPVTGADGVRREARVVATSRPLDLALLALSGDGLPPATIGESARLRVGEMVFALGHPWGQPWAVSAGIVSGLGPRDYLRSDVRLAPGCSGGPLVDACGRVVGVNTLVLGGDLAVALSSDAARRWVESLA
ncbi:MAG TPA: serine protease [Methylomirabilota bacterium]|nr:serine protease [Methylomirabilota bacterium]